MWMQKIDDEGKKKQYKEWAEKKLLQPNRGLKYKVHGHYSVGGPWQDRVPELQFTADH
jgi:hypothetical protein